MSDLISLDNISKKNGDIKCYELGNNMIEARTGRDGWGYVKIAVDNETISEMFVRDTYTGALYLVSREEYRKERSDHGNINT